MHAAAALQRVNPKQRARLAAVVRSHPTPGQALRCSVTKARSKVRNPQTLTAAHPHR